MISVVAPMYNEAEKIATNVEKLLVAMHSLPEPWEIVLINDGSTDQTAEIVQALADTEPRIRLVSYTPNRGRGYALRMGFEAARGKYIVTTESDLSWGEEIVPRLYRALLDQDLDMVIASPYLPGGGLENVPWKRAFLSRWGNRLLSFASRRRLTMLTGMTRAYRREVLEGMDLESEGKEMHLEIASKALALGYRIGEIPAMLRWDPPAPGIPRRRSTFHAGRLITSHLLFGFGEYPFLLFGGVGLALLILGTLAGLYAWYLGLHGVQITRRPILFAAILFVLFGGQMLIFGFLASQNRELRNRLVRMEQKILRLLRDRETSS